jgi:hypothetical protein
VINFIGVWCLCVCVRHVGVHVFVSMWLCLCVVVCVFDMQPSRKQELLLAYIM